MRFWDSSAVAPLIIEQRSSRACRSLYRADPSVALWTFTRTEVVSVVQRLRCEGLLADRDVTKAIGRLDALVTRAAEVTSLDAVRERAERALSVHALRAADALQLGAALILVGDRPKRRPFVVADARLADAARREGFDVIVPGA
jgi:predicted nucleic acid-binding protein